MHNHPHLNKLHQLINDGGIQLKPLLYNKKKEKEEGHGVVGMTPPGTHTFQIQMFLENAPLTSVLDLKR